MVRLWLLLASSLVALGFHRRVCEPYLRGDIGLAEAGLWAGLVLCGMWELGRLAARFEWWLFGPDRRD